MAKVARKRITEQMIVAFYPTVKEVAQGKITQAEGIQRMVRDLKMNKNSARDYIKNFKTMLKGKEYQRVNKLFAVEFYRKCPANGRLVPSGSL